MEIPSLEWYVLRIYRRDDEDPEFVRGIVELVGTREQVPIKSVAELRDVLFREGKRRINVHNPQSAGTAGMKACRLSKR